MKASNYVAIMGFLLVFYVILFLISAILTKNLSNSIFLILFALSPFIIGPFATYEKRKFYTGLQIFTIISSVIYIFCIAG